MILHTYIRYNPSVQALLDRLSQKKAKLDSYRPLPPALVKNLDDWFRVELTYTPNAIEGNTLTRNEMALVIELRNIAVRIAGSTAILPSPAKLATLMKQFVTWLNAVEGHPAEVAADAHFKLVSIHPCVDGNGRTARLLMNLLLMQAGYPPALIHKEERLAYINAIEHAESDGDFEPYYRVIYGGIERSLDIYLHAVES